VRSFRKKRFLATCSNRAVTSVRLSRTKDPQRKVDSSRFCGFIFLDRRRKRNIVGEFARIFEAMVGEYEMLIEREVCLLSLLF